MLTLTLLRMKIYQHIMSHFKKKPKSDRSLPRYWNRPIDEKHISSNALKVLAGLHAAGFDAYLVGGGVRDLLVGKIPKDFDVATNASPEQIRRIFRNSRIIGKRFRLVHVFYRQEIIEVSTFRAQITEPSVSASLHARTTNNTFGTIEEDAWRRDFTVNALYYKPQDNVVVDFTGGIEDLDSKLIRIIGDPMQRFHEDPVRLLRAVRLSAKLQFEIHENTETQLRDLPALLEHVAQSRLFDEVVKLFFTGHAWSTYQKLNQYNYFSILFPLTAEALNGVNSSDNRILLDLAMHGTDQRYKEQSSLNPGFLLAVLLWPAIHRMIRDQPRRKFNQTLRHAIEEVLSKQMTVLVIPHRLTAMMRSIWLLQFSLLHPRGQRAYRTLFHRYFRAAIDFLELRVNSGEPHQEILAWWQKFRHANTEDREKMIDNLK